MVTKRLEHNEGSAFSPGRPPINPRPTRWRRDAEEKGIFHPPRRIGSPCDRGVDSSRVTSMFGDREDYSELKGSPVQLSPKNPRHEVPYEGHKLWHYLSCNQGIADMPDPTTYRGGRRR